MLEGVGNNVRGVLALAAAKAAHGYQEGQEARGKRGPRSFGTTQQVDGACCRNGDHCKRDNSSAGPRVAKDGAHNTGNNSGGRKSSSYPLAFALQPTPMLGFFFPVSNDPFAAIADNACVSFQQIRVRQWPGKIGNGTEEADG